MMEREPSGTHSRGPGPAGLSADGARARLVRIWDGLAPRYDRLVALPEWLILGRRRRRLLAEVSGRVLELAVGTGRNLPHYPAGCRLTAVDLSGGMLDRARRRASRRGHSVALLRMDAQRLAFRDASFDTIVDTLTLCTYPDPAAALREMIRVCRPGGRVLLLEHGRSDRPLLARWQDRGAARHEERYGCCPVREPLDLVRASGLRVESSSRSFFGTMHRIEATVPGPP